MKRHAAAFALLAAGWLAGAQAGSPPSADPADRNAVRAYGRALLEGILRDQQYPGEALRRGIEGRVLVEALIGRDGQVSNARLLESSGSALLDQAAMRKVLAARELPLPPPGLRNREFRIGFPIIFRID